MKVACVGRLARSHMRSMQLPTSRQSMDHIEFYSPVLACMILSILYRSTCDASNCRHYCSFHSAED